MLRRVYLQELLALVVLVLGVVAASIAGMTFAVSLPARGIARAFGEGIAVVWWLAPIVLVVLHRRGRLDDRMTDPTRLRVLLPLARLLVGFGVIALAYSNLKADLPRVNGMLADPELLQADTILGFGRPLNQRLGAISAHWFVAAMNAGYLSFFYYFPIAMAVALFRADVEMLEEVVQGFAVVLCLGLVGYYGLPSLGTIYTHPEWHEAARSTDVWRVRDSLLRQQLAIVAGHPTGIHAFFGIGAFPSLHVAHALVALDITRRRMPRVAALALLPFAVMVMSTLYFGWHYAVDLIGAVVVAWTALRLVRWDRVRRVGNVQPASSPSSADNSAPPSR